MTNFSIWVVLPKEIHKIINPIIKELSEKYNGVIFEPHITLLGSFLCDEKEVVEKTKKLAIKIKKLNLEFGEVSFSTTYFQNVFVRIKSIADLMNASLVAKKEFGAENKFFMPHVSLLYGGHSMEIREKITKEVKLPHLKFKAEKIVVILEGKEPKRENYLGEYELG